MGKKLTIACVTASVMGIASLSMAAGLRVNEQGAKAMGMGNAFAAQADDPTALYYNPAGIAFLKGTRVSLGSVIISVPETEFSGTTPLSGASGTTPVFEKAKKDLFIVPSLYVTYALENIPLTFGLGVNSIYPLAKSWDDSSAFRNQVTNISVKPINFQPTVAYRFDGLNLALAAGLDVTHAIVNLQKFPFAPDAAQSAVPLGAMGVDGTATDFGYNLGMKWKPRPDLSLGVAYRSEITLNIDGRANFLATSPTGHLVIGLNAANANSQTRATSSASTTVTLPDSLTLALAWQPTERLTLEFDAERTGWSSFKKLEINFPNPQFANFNNQPTPLNWEDVWAYKFGAQYAWNKNLDLRAGYMYDTNPIPDSTLGPILPDSDRHSFSVGSGIHVDNIALDMAYMFTHFEDRTVNNQDMVKLAGENGTFTSDVHLFGATLTVRF
ncbi:MAG: outer membrane protein transport protein [Deltaproteobacteria bacterium]|nr:outer membrane protein transport protein [Deltaproteobacteria bacterium]